MTNYDKEVESRFGNTDAYKECKQKTADYTNDKWKEVSGGLNAVFAKFAECKKSGHTADSEKAQAIVKELQDYITQNFYTCGDEILAGLGKMYIADERFKENIDQNGIGTTDFASKAIEIYCK